MKRTFLFILSLLIGVLAYAADFKVGEAKYLVLSDGTAELKEFKKATGDVVIPEKITDPKSGHDYTVSSIGEGAFKKSTITSVSIPSTVINIGDRAFMDCKNLVTVHYPENLDAIPSNCFRNCKSLTSFDLNGIKIILDWAFDGSGLTSLDIPESVKLIGRLAFGGCSDLKAVTVQSSDEELVMYPGVMYGTPVESVFIGRPLYYRDTGIYLDKYRLYNNNPALKSLWIGPNVLINPKDKYLEDCPNAVVVFLDKDAGEQAWNLLRSMCVDNAMSWVEPYYQPGGNKDMLGNVRSFEDYITGTLSVRNMSLPQGSFYFGVEETENGSALSQDSPYNTASAIQVAYDNYDKEKFLKKIQEFVRVAVNEPEKLQNEYRGIDPKESVKYNSYLTNAVRVLCDSVYLVKPQLSQAEVNNVYGFINNFVMAIGADHGIANCMLEKWAENDLLNKDIKAGEHKEDYERILKSSERLLKYVLDNNNDDYDYLIALQLVGLCGLERWEDASRLFPKFIRLYTDNGKRNVNSVPYEITYMQKAINSHGYKAVVPNFTKKQSSSSSSKITSSDIEFFTEAAINAGINHYKKKKAEKEFRELYYDSIGLDAKGRPRKRKK